MMTKAMTKILLFDIKIYIDNDGKKSHKWCPPPKQWITVRKGVGMCVMSKCNKMLPASKNNMFRAETSVRGHFVSF